MNTVSHLARESADPFRRGRALLGFGAALLLTALGTAPVAHAQAAPTLVSVTPANGSTNVAVDSPLVFVFDQAMDTDVPVVPSIPPFLVGNLETTPAGLISIGTWSEDGRTLTCQASADLPADTVITWRLNPTGAVLPFASAEGTELATVSGNFTTGTGCDQDNLPESWGQYSLFKNLDRDQTSTADPVPSSETPFMFGALVTGPQSGPAVTAGSVTPPGRTPIDLDPAVMFLSFFDEPTNEMTLEADYPAGNYTLRFTQSGQPERQITMTMPATFAAVPKIANFAAAQTVNAGQDFTLSWNAFLNPGASGFISMYVSDETTGNILFQAPDVCVPRELPVSATSIVIPANTLQSNKTYRAALSFGQAFYQSTNTVPEMAGVGILARTTYFPLSTGAGGGPVVPASLANIGLLPNGRPQFSLSGSALRSYTVERTGSLTNPNWTTAGTVSMDAAGSAVFEESQDVTFPAFYRAVGN